ncbi:MAG: FHA domain-containing protein [Clostridia bacterium]|nr:FHA domain-containing protein [Clostridia bacterium]
MFEWEQSNENLLRYTVAPDEALDRYTIEALRRSPIPGIAPVGLPDEADGTQILLPTASLVPLSVRLRESDGPSVALAVLEQAVERLRAIRSYLIPSSELLLQLRFSFYDPEHARLVLFVLPTSGAAAYREELPSYLRSIAAAAITDTPGTDPAARETLLTVLELLNRDPFSLPDLLRVLREPGTKPSATEKEEPRTEPETPPRSGWRERIRRFLEDTDREEMPDETEEYVEGTMCFEWRATGRRVPLGRSAVIGSDPERAQIVLSQNSFAEPEHCRVFWEAGGYRIEDLHSKSGTWVRGRKVRPWTAAVLSPGDTVRIGEEELVFRKS